MGNEILEILRNYDRMTIYSINSRIGQKEEIVKQRTSQILQSPSKRARSNYKSGSPRASPRTGVNNYSPTNSNKSGRHSEASSNKGSSKNLAIKPKIKLVKPTFEYQA